MNIKLKQITKTLPEYKKIRSLYLTAFPADERAPFSLLASGARKTNVDWWAIYNDDIWAGFFYIVNDNDLSYIFYFAIDDYQRGNGLGSAALQLLQQQYNNRRLFLAIEELDKDAANYDERVKRKQFYQHNNFNDLHTRMLEGRVIYELMGIGGSVSKQEYKHLINKWLGLWRFIIPTKILD